MICDERLIPIMDGKIANKVVDEVEANEITDRDNLAVVYRVEKLEPIPNKDRIEICHMKDCGYTSIVEKGLHQIGNTVVFIKYDTVVPDNELFDFMKESKFRVKPKSFTIRDDNDEVVDKIYSQGIVLPISKVEEQYFGFQRYFSEGTDLTEIIGVKKYIPPVQKGGGTSFGVMQAKGTFPTHIISKTDEMNVCSKMRALEELQGQAVYITQKIEGSSITFFLDQTTHELIVCSRNMMLSEVEGNKFWQAVKKHNIEEKLISMPQLACQAELYGEGIQKNKLGIKGVDIAIFNMVDLRTKRRLSWMEMKKIAREFELPLVPVVCEIYSFDWSFEKLQKFADIQKYENGEVAEGIVIRPMIPFFSSVLKDLWSVKCINRDYKL